MILHGKREKELRRLISGMCDKALTYREMRMLEDLLANDPDALAYYVQYLEVHTTLAWAISAGSHHFAGDSSPCNLEQNSPQLAKGTGGRVVRFFSQPTAFSITAAALVIGLLITAMAFMAPPFYRFIGQRKERRELNDAITIVAQLTNAREAKWGNGQVGIRPGSKLPKGHHMHLLEGWAEVTYGDGARVILEGPASFRIDGSGTGTLSVGKLVARVPRSAVGFQVRTPGARIVDLGTEFGVWVAPDGSSQLHVFEGVVEAFGQQANAAESVRLAAGQAAHFDTHGKQLEGQWECELAARAFVRQLPAYPGGFALGSKRVVELPPPVLTAYYDFEGDFDDAPGAGQFADNLKPTGGSLVFDPSPAKGSTQSYTFNNAETYQVASTNAYSADLTSGNAYTIMFWVKADDQLMNMTNSRLMTLRFRPDGTAATNPAWQVEGHGLQDGNQMDLRIIVKDQTGASVNWFAPDAIGAMDADGDAATDKWHHVAFVAANFGSPGRGYAYVQTYVDGVSVGLTEYRKSTWRSIGNRDGMLIVGGINGKGRSSRGLLDDVALWDGVVPAADIAAIAAGKKSPADFLVESPDRGDALSKMGR